METSQELFRALGMTLIHSIWQGAIIAAGVMLILIFTNRNNSRARYAVHFSGLLTLLASFIITFVIVLRNNQVLKEFQQAVLALPQGNDLLKALPVTGKGFFVMVLDFFEPFSNWFALFWITGFVITAIRMTGGAIAARLMFRRGLTLPGEHITELFIKLKQCMRIASNVKLKISAATISPLVTGIFMPMVIIPASAVTGMSLDQLRAVLIHELAHIRRYDPIFVIIQAFARLILFFHPLAWYLFREIDRERENCCDDYVILNNRNPINYIKALAMIEEMNLPGTTANALTGSKNELLSRIRRLLKPRTGYSAVFRLSVITLAVLIVGVISTAFIITEQPDLKRDTKDKKASVQPSSEKNVSASLIPDGKDGDKKKMVIIFNNDTIKEITVDGKKLSREEMKDYAEDIRKVQRELEDSQDELRMAHRELENAHRQLELAQKELHDKNLNEQLNQELALKNFHFEFNNQQWQSQEFQNQMKKLQEEAWNAIRNGQNSLDYLNSEEFKEQMKKAREEMRLAWEKNKELWNSEEFKEQMREASEAAREAFEEFRKNGNFNNEFKYHFRYDGDHAIPPVPPVPDFQEPPAPRPDQDADEVPEVPEKPELEEQPEVHEIEIPEQPEVQKGEIPQPVEAPEVDEDIDVDEQIEAPEKNESDTGKPDSDERAKELDTKLRELEQE